jgi:hypothetical protein
MTTHTGFPINGPHTLTIAQRLKVHSSTRGNRQVAEYRWEMDEDGRHNGWRVRVDRWDCRIYVESEDEAQTCLAAVEKALR